MNVATYFSRCISVNYRCDGEDDCGDGSDEFHCGKIRTWRIFFPSSAERTIFFLSHHLSDKTNSTCKDDEFQCRRGKACIPYEKVCDKVSDCSDGSDEPLHCGVDECRKVEDNGCGHRCVDTKESFRCECRDGYKLMADGKACADVDECVEVPGACSQQCVNTEGSYNCKCNQEYYSREADGRGCKRKDGQEAWLLFTNKYYIRNMTVSAARMSLVHQDLKNVVSMDFHYGRQEIYFADVSARVIYRSKVGESARTPVVSDHANGLEGVSIDWVNDKLYWLDRNTQHMYVSELDGTNRKTIMVDIEDPRAIAVHPGNGFVFFTSWNLHAFIGRVGMNGDPETFVRIHSTVKGHEVAWPNALTIDFFTDRIWWADAHLDYIAYADFNGNNVHKVVGQARAPHVFALSVFDDYLYWTDWNLKAILKANKFTGKTRADDHEVENPTPIFFPNF